MLLFIDSLVNLGLGVILLFFPIWVESCFGIPVGGSTFYPRVLGGVLFGVGIALFIEWRRLPTPKAQIMSGIYSVIFFLVFCLKRRFVVVYCAQHAIREAA